MHLNLDDIYEGAYCYADNHSPEPVALELNSLFNLLSSMDNGYINNEVWRVTDSINLSLVEDDDFKELRNLLDGIDPKDVAWIAAHVGFTAGMLHTLRLQKKL